eukprot:3811632-Lingulodinium_polyedra.AAC.1
MKATAPMHVAPAVCTGPQRLSAAADGPGLLPAPPQPQRRRPGGGGGRAAAAGPGGLAAKP